MNEFLHSLKKQALNLVFPNRCPFCGRVIEVDKLYCEDCYENLPFMPYKLKAPENVSRLVICCKYENAARDAVLRYKFGSVIYPAEVFAVMMVRRLREMNISFDVIAAVPSALKSVINRGFSSAGRIAYEISRITGVPVVKALRSKLFKAEQKKLTTKGREENAGNSFYYNKKAVVSGMRILLVDDVFTTGNTIKATAGILKENGAAEVVACVFSSANHNRNLFVRRSLTSTRLKKPRGIPFEK